MFIRPGPLQDAERHARPRQGDLLLQQVAKRLATCVREGDTVARLGGRRVRGDARDLSENPAEAATQAEAWAKRFSSLLNQPYVLAGYENHTTRASASPCLTATRPPSKNC